MGIRVLLAAMFLVGCGHCGQRGGGEKEFEGYVNTVCACKDIECIREEGIRYAEKHKNVEPGQGDARPSKKMVELTAKMADCNKKVMDQAMNHDHRP